MRALGADFSTRLVSGVVMAAVAAVALSLGGVWVALLVAGAAGVMAWEWRGIASGGQYDLRRALPMIAACAGAALLVHLAGARVAMLWLAAAGAVAVALDAASSRRWTLLGALAVGLPCVAFVWLRDDPRFGLMTCLWLVLIVAATDIGGYVFGRLIGGPKLAPRLSPKKTWAGMGGGVVLAFVLGGIFSALTVGTYAGEVCIVSALAAMVSQAGDLAESAFKRRFGVKDASTLIPGHGGVLDRVDGLLAATLVVAVITVMRGQEVFVW